MSMTCDFFNCSGGLLPFKYLGLLVGANLCRVATWDPLLNQLSKRLNSWGNKYISFGGGIVFINSVLNVIPIFYLSCFKMPVKVWKKVVRIQREFLLGGMGGGNKIRWLKWETVCSHKYKKGLGVKHVKLVNLSLLAKWRWRLLQGDHALWKDVLMEKYGRDTFDMVVGERDPWARWVSKWWKNLASLEDGGDFAGFNEEVERKVGNGLNTRFWQRVCRGGESFMLKYMGVC